MDYENVISIERIGKEITFFLEKGEKLTLDNIMDVEIYPKSPWVDIEDREPKEAKAYWVATDNPRSTMMAIWSGGSWVKHHAIPKSGKISHWMNIPTPPDEKINIEEDE